MKPIINRGGNCYEIAKIKDVTLQVCIQHTLADVIRERADDNGMSVSHYIRWIIGKELQEKK